MVAVFRLVAGLAMAAAVTCSASLPAAADWPDRPVSLVLPFPAGGPNDVLARLLGKKLSEDLGQQFVVENKVGASGNIGAAAVAKAKPDGYTLLLTSTGPAVNNKFLFPSLTFDPTKDFVPVALVSKIPIAFVARKAAPFSTLQAFVAAAKAAPDKYTIAVAGIGSVSHIASELFQREAGIKLVTVPFPGSTPIISALMSESIDVVSDLIPAHIPLLRDQRYTSLAIASDIRIPSLPQLQTVAEAGFPNFEASTFSALVAPAGTPDAIVQRLNRLVNDWLGSQDGRAQLATLEMLPSGGSPQDLQKLMDSEGAKWGPLIKSAGITAQ